MSTLPLNGGTLKRGKLLIDDLKYYDKKDGGGKRWYMLSIFPEFLYYYIVLINIYKCLVLIN